ncbi:MAG: pitrilysin family protein [Alphaproteobacteria bacterium]|jgi:predicted Zn-dependent peptidase
MKAGTLTTLSNGLRVATRHMPHATSVSIGIWVNAGARDERPQEQGIAHMLEHMAFKGTTRRDAQAIATEVEDVGGYMNAHTSREETAYYLRLLPEHLPLAVDILADILTESTLPEIEIERERGVIIQEIGQSLDTPDDLVFDLFSKSAHQQHTLGRPILGTIESVSGFDRGDLGGFMTRHYGAGQMLVCAAGAIEHDDLVRRVEERLGGLANATDTHREVPSWSAGRELVKRDLEQTHVVMGLPGIGANDDDRFAVMAFSTLLGGGMSSRLFQQVREKRGLCYSIFSFASMLSDSGHFAVYAGTSADKVDEMLSVVCAEISTVASKVTNDEVDRAKAQLRASLLMSRESVSGCGDALARQIMLFGKPVDDQVMLAAIDDVDAAKISRVVQRLITSGAPALAAVGPSTKIMSNDALAAALAA